MRLDHNENYEVVIVHVSFTGAWELRLNWMPNKKQIQIPTWLQWTVLVLMVVNYPILTQSSSFYDKKER